MSGGRAMPTTQQPTRLMGGEGAYPRKPLFPPACSPSCSCQAAQTQVEGPAATGTQGVWGALVRGRGGKRGWAEPGAVGSKQWGTHASPCDFTAVDSTQAVLPPQA